MANSPFGNLNLGGLGGIVKSLSGLMPQDDPSVQMLNAHTSVNELKTQIEQLYAEIGRKAVDAYGVQSFPAQADRLKLLESNLEAEEKKLGALQSSQEERERAETEAREARTCPECGLENPEGTRFCQECGCKLGEAKRACVCIQCGAKLEPGIRFCGECGARQEG